MEFCWITLNVNDLEESLKFYHELLGLSVFSRFKAGEDTEIAMLGEEDKPKIELIDNKNIDNPINAEGISIGFEVDSLDRTMKYLKDKGIAIERGPFSPNPSIRFFFINDPNGIDIQLVENKEN